MMRKQTQEKLDIRTVVLVGRQDFGRCPLAAHLPTALWPIVNKPAVERLLEKQGTLGRLERLRGGESLETLAAEVEEAASGKED